jgi:hypothetical protein
VSALALVGVSVAASAVADPTFTISGQVSSLIGYPAGAAQVTAGFYDGTSWQYPTSVDVGADGEFSLDETTGGDYDLFFSVTDFSTPFVDSYFGTGVTEPDGSDATNPGVIDASAATDVTGLDVTLVPAGYITGTATSDGVPAVGVYIDAYDSASNTEYDAPAATDSTGAYSIKVAADTPLEVETDGQAPYEYQAYDGHNGCGCTFDPVTVGAGLTKTGIDFNLLEPIDLLSITFVDDPPNSGAPTDGTVELYRQVAGGYELVDSEVVDPGTGESVFEIAGGGNMHLRVSTIDPTTHATVWYSIEAYAVADLLDVIPPVEYEPPLAPVCSVPLSALQAGDERLVEIALLPDTTQCGAEPAIVVPTAPVVHHHHAIITTPSVPVATPTPTPTPTPTETPSSSPSPSPSASTTPAPTVTSSTGGLPWWVWLLIVVGILILAGIAFVLFRRR